eukprot:3084004-Pleurochrysis_carterae.AAC.1
MIYTKLTKFFFAPGKTWRPEKPPCHKSRVISSVYPPLTRGGREGGGREGGGREGRSREEGRRGEGRRREGG